MQLGLKNMKLVRFEEVLEWSYSLENTPRLGCSSNLNIILQTRKELLRGSVLRYLVQVRGLSSLRRVF